MTLDTFLSTRSGGMYVLRAWSQPAYGCMGQRENT